MVGKLWAPSAASLAAALLLASGCADAPQPLAKQKELTTGGEVFHILCKRVAAAAYPNELTGMRFNAPCDGDGVVDAEGDPRLAAMIERRAEIVAALDQVFGDAPSKGTAEFATGELDTFLANLIPFYDPPDEWTPKSTRALAQVLAELLADKPASKRVLSTLARVAPRVGYRPIKQALGAVRPAVTYPGLDELTRQFLKLVTSEGSAYPVFVDLLKAGALELAEPKAADAPEPADSTLRAAMQLLMTSDPSFAPEDGPPLWVVQRDDLGFATLADGSSTGGKVKQSPFARSLTDKKNRDKDGRAMNGEEPFYQYIDANRTLFAGLMREQHPLLKRNGDKSVVEKLAYGFRPALGATVNRTEAFGSKASLKFKGPDVENGAVFELVHALGAMARYPETEDLLALLEVLMKDHEADAAAPVYAGLRIDEISDEYPDAKIIGVDGEGTPHEFWDDLIQVGLRMLERPGQLEAVIRSFADPQSVASTKLIAKFMKFKDQVTYNGAPITVQSDGKFAAADAEKMNSEIEHTLKTLVERAGAGEPSADVGMNRSLWQRLISTIHATNGVPNCNKENAQLLANDPLTGGALTFPDPAGQAPGDLIAGIADLACGEMPKFTGKKGYPECEFVKQPNGAETHMRSMVPPTPPGKAVVVIKDDQLHCLEEAGLAHDLGETQEESAQITGFTLTPSARSLARFIHVPRNRFSSSLFDPFATKHGVPLVEFEPDILFSLEIKQPDVVFNNEAQSFLTASQPLAAAFDGSEIFIDTEDGPYANKGYMFAELLATLHMHWPSRRPADFRCPATVKKGDEGCSQSGDPTAKFFAHQSNLVSYEPLLVRALEDENLGGILQKANATLGKIKIKGVDGKERDGISVLTAFAQRLLTIDEELTYRDGRSYSVTNTCVPVESSGASGDIVVECADDRGRVIMGPNGKGVMPLYLMLDALKSIDEAFEGEAERHEHWLAARSALVDQFLAVTKDETDPNAVSYALKNRRAYATALKALPWIRERIKFHRETANDLDAWATGLAGRLASVLGHPATAAGLDLLDVLWNEKQAGEEFAKVSAYLLDEEGNPEAFEGLIVAAVDTLMLIDRDPDLTPLVQFASLALAPNALEIMDKGDKEANKGVPDVEGSVTMSFLELTKRITDLYPKPEDPKVKDETPINRLLKNSVLADKNGQSPLEEFIDSAAEVNRKTPTDPRDKPLTADDYRAVFEQVHAFLTDQDRGLERLYRVIQGRDLDRAN